MEKGSVTMEGERNIENGTLFLPNGVEKLETQVAGHMFTPGAKTLGMLRDLSQGYVLKPLGKPQCGERELKFYQELNNNANMNALSKIRPYIPKFYGIVQHEVNGTEHTFLKLEDLTYQMRKPCIMDIKVGKNTWDPFATTEKRLLEEQKYKCCKESLGLCLPGFQMYSKNSDGQEVVLRYGREYGKQLNREGFYKTLELFLHFGNPVYHSMRQELLRQLYVIHNWFKNQTVFHFYASSLLIVYDLDAIQTRSNLNIDISRRNGVKKDVQDYVTSPAALSGNEMDAILLSNNRNNIYRRSTTINSKTDMVNELETPFIRNSTDCGIKVRMIDFAHVFPASTDSQESLLDTNYMFGLQNLIQILEDSVMDLNSTLLLKNVQNYDEYNEYGSNIENNIIQCRYPSYLRNH